MALVKQADARILREALAYCANYGKAHIRDRALTGLKRYADVLKKYCRHPELVAMEVHLKGTLNVKQIKRCIDCGYTIGDKS